MIHTLYTAAYIQAKINSLKLITHAKINSFKISTLAGYTLNVKYSTGESFPHCMFRWKSFAVLHLHCAILKYKQHLPA